MTRLGALVLSPVLSAALAVLVAMPVAADPARRIVSAGGSVTEIVYALGQEGRLVARDSTSTYPEAARELPDIGYVRRLSPEGLLSVDPDLILVEDGAGPPEALALIRETEIPVVTIPMGFDRAAVLAKIAAVAEALDMRAQGAALAARIAGEIDAATADVTGPGQRVLFVLSVQDGRLLAAGQNTAADGVIRMAGAQNAVTGFDGYKQLSDEAVLSAAPDAILLMEARGNADVAQAELLAHPAIKATPAGKNAAVICMDGMLLLGFSVRTGQAVTELAAGLRALVGKT
jgi:iron complex transport system substrate-binding protein